MADRIIVTFDKSQEDIPVLATFVENPFAFLAQTPSIKLINMITGDKAVEMWNELCNRKDEDEECHQ